MRKFRQRFGLCLNDYHYKQIIRIINQGKAKFIEKQSNRITVWELEYLGKKFHCVYDRKRHSIATFLYTDPEQYKSQEDVWNLINTY